jgi:hypothetical protein
MPDFFGLDAFGVTKLVFYITCAGYLLWFIKPKDTFGGSGGGGQTTVEKNDIPQYLQDFAQENIGKAKDIANAPYQQYQGPRIAGFNDLQNQGQQATLGQIGQYQPALTQAEQLTQQMSQGGTQPGLAQNFQDALNQAQGIYSNTANNNLTNTDLSAYMNPYDQQVTQQAIQQAQQAGSQTRNQISGQLAKAGAWGGSRQGVVEAQQLKDQNANIANMALQGNQASYDKAVSAFNADRTANLAGAQGLTSIFGQGLQQQGLNQQYDLGNRQLGLQGAGQMANLAGLGQQMGYTDAAALLDLGQRQQDQTQKQYDTNYTDFLNQQNYPIEMLNVLLSAANGTPYSTTRTQTATGGGTDQTGAIVGGIGTVAASAAMVY